MIEAKKLAYEDRAKFYADPEFSKVPVAALISKEYAATRAPLIDRDRANDRPIPGEPAGADTIYMTVVDKDFNAVSLIQSNFNGFGSQHVPGRPRASRSRTAAASSPSTPSTPTGSSLTSGRSTRSSPASSPRRASPGSASA